MVCFNFQLAPPHQARGVHAGLLQPAVLSDARSVRADGSGRASRVHASLGVAGGGGGGGPGGGDACGAGACGRETHDSTCSDRVTRYPISIRSSPISILSSSGHRPYSCCHLPYPYCHLKVSFHIDSVIILSSYGQDHHIISCHSARVARHVHVTDTHFEPSFPESSGPITWSTRAMWYSARPWSDARWKHGARWCAHVAAFGVIGMFLQPPPPPGQTDLIPPEVGSSKCCPPAT
jgi:hypothetical protein